MTISECILAAAKAFHVEPEWILSDDRSRAVAWPRHAAMWLARSQGFTSPRIGRSFHRDHTTVLYGCNNAEFLADDDEEFGDRLQMAWIFLDRRRDATGPANEFTRATPHGPRARANLGSGR